MPLFAAVQNGGDEQLAAQAIYYQVDAALNARAINADQAHRCAGAAALPLARRRAGNENPAPAGRALFRQQPVCATGLKTLRVATQNFQNNDAARAAQDDMRAAFANLYLKGGADKMPPVEQLALFYDNVDLTPIGVGWR